MKIPHWLTKRYEIEPESVALSDPTGMTITFSDLYKESRRVAASIREVGIKEGDHIALLLENEWSYPVLIHAASYIGAVLVLLNTRLTPEELRFQLDDADVKAVFSSEATREKAAASMNGLNIPHYQIGQLPQSSHTEGLKMELDLDEVFTMIYTSGTTGKPKAVMHTYGNHWHSAIASALNLGLNSDDCWLLCLPLFHVGGFSILMKSVIYGMRIDWHDQFDAKAVTRSIQERGVTHMSVVTVMLQRLLREIGEGQYPSSFRCMLLGGGPVPETVLEEAKRKQIPVYQTYGMTETSSQIATLRPADALRKLGSAGKALSTATLKVESDKRGKVGEILVKGPMVASRYYKRPQNDEPYFRTGDAGYEDDDGFLFIVDRVKDVIISGGENIYPAEIESILTEMTGVVEAGVTARADEEWGEVPVAFLVTDQNITKSEVEQFCQTRLARYKIPKDVHFLQELPRNASNKLVRRKLFDRWKEETHEH